MKEIIHLVVGRLDTPLGEMLIATDADRSLRAVKWTNHEERMLYLLRRYYGTDGFKGKRLVFPSGQMMSTDDKSHGCDCVAGTEAASFRRVEEKLRIVKLTLEPGASVASMALAERRERQPGVSLEATVRTWRVAAAQVEVGRCSGAGDHRGRTGSARSAREFESRYPRRRVQAAITIEFPGGHF